MNISIPQLSKKISAEVGAAASSDDTEKPSGHFRQLLEISAVDEHAPRSLFSLIEEEEEEEDPKLVEETYTPLPPPSLLMHAVYTPLAGVDMVHVSQTASSPHIDILFENMASRMILMDLSQETHTTLVLDHPQLTGSVFFGTTITIKEFATAPKAFNIEILSNPTAIAAIVQQQNQLLSRFATGHFPFTIHRLDTGIQQEAEPPLVPRLEDDDRDHQDKQKDQDS